MYEKSNEIKIKIKVHKWIVLEQAAREAKRIQTLLEGGFKFSRAIECFNSDCSGSLSTHNLITAYSHTKEQTCSHLHLVTAFCCQITLINSIASQFAKNHPLHDTWKGLIS